MLSKRNLIIHTIVISLIGLFCFIKLFVFTCEGNIAVSDCKLKVFNPNENLIGIKSDDYQYMGFMYLTHQNISEFKMPFAFNNYFRYPSGFNYEYGFDGAFPVFLGAILLFFTNLILSYNLVIFIILFLNIYISYIFLSKISKIKSGNENVLLSLTAAFIFGSSSYVIARLNSHTNMAVIFGFPILLYSLIRLFEEFEKESKKIAGSIIASIYLGLFFIIAGSIQFSVMIGFIFILFVIYSLIKYRLKFFAWLLKAMMQNKLLFVFGTFIFFSVFMFFFHGYVLAALGGSLNTRYLAQKISNANFANFFFPNQYIGSWFNYINQMPPSMESVITLGIIPMLLFLFAIFQNIKKRDTTYTILTVFVFLFFMFGLVRLPFLPQAGRLVVLLSLLSSFYLLLNLRVSKKILLIAIFLFVILEKFTYSIYQNPIELPYYKFVRELEGTAVLNVPLNQYEPQRSILPYFFDKKIMDGYFHFPAINVISTKNFADKYFSRFDCNSLRDGLVDENYGNVDVEKVVEFSRANDIKYMILHKDDSIGNIYQPGCENVLRWMSYITPKQIIIESSTNGVVKNDLVFSKDEGGVAYIRINGHGKLYINDISVYADKNINVLMESKFGQEVFTKKAEELLDQSSAGLIPAIIDVVEGDEVILKLLNDDINQVRYLTLYYAFDGVSADIRQEGYFNKIYEDQHVDIYKIF